MVVKNPHFYNLQTLHVNDEQRLTLLQNLFTETNAFYLAYKKEQDKILYFAGTIFISIITLTGIFGAYQTTNIIYNFHWYHLLIFHTIFFILYLFYTYKMLCAEIYLMIGLETQTAIERLFKVKNSQIPSLSSFKNKFLGDSMRIRPLKRGMNPGKVANILILALYCFTSISPYVWLQVITEKETGLMINSSFWTALITILFIMIFIVVDRNIHKRRKEIRKDVRKEMQSKFDAFIKIPVTN